MNGQGEDSGSMREPITVQMQIPITIGDAERMLVFATLTATENNKTRAAELLGISLKTLHNKLHEYGRA